MGAISKIRQLSPYALATIVCLFLAFMIMQDCAGNAAFNGPKSADQVTVAEINGDKITLADYEHRVQTIIDAQRQQAPNQEIDDESIRSQVFEEMINEILRKQELKKLGLSVTQQELVDAIVHNPSPDLQRYMQDSTGKFDRRRWQDLVTNPNTISEQMAQQGASEAEIEKQMKMVHDFLFQVEDQVRMQKLEEALRTTVEAAASNVSPLYAELDYKTQNSTADVKFVAIPAERISDDAAKPTDEELKAYYEANKQYYEQKRSRRVKYVIFPQTPGEKDSATANKRSMQLQEAFGALPTVQQRDSAFTVAMEQYNGTSNNFKPVNEIDPSESTILMSLQNHDVFGPLNVVGGIKFLRLDSMQQGTNVVARASHILVPFGTDKEAAKKTADSILKVARGGADFAMLATAHSKDPGSASQGGDLGFFAKGRMVKEFEEAAFNNPVGSYVGPVETQFGYHIIKVTDKQSTELKYSEVLIKPIMSSATKQQILAKAAQMQKRIEDGAPIDTLAKELRLKTVESPFLQANSPFLSSAELTSWIFDEKQGAVTRRDIKQYGLVLAQITDVREAGTKPFEDVKEQITQTVTTKKKLDKVKGLAEQVATACKSAGSIDGYKNVDSTLDFKIQTAIRNNGQLLGYGNEYAATQAAFSQPIGSVSGAIRGNRAWFVMVTDARQDADMAAFKAQKQIHTQSIASQVKGNVYYTWFQSVRDNAEIVDKRFNRD